MPLAEAADAAASGSAAGSASLAPDDALSEAGATPAPGGRRRTLAWVAGVVVAALIIGLIAWFAVQRPGGTAAPTVGDSTTPSPMISTSSGEVIRATIATVLLEPRSRAATSLPPATLAPS